MKLPARKYLVGLGALLVLPVLVFWSSGGLRGDSGAARLGVRLVAVDGDPLHRRVERSTVLNGELFAKRGKGQFLYTPEVHQ